MYIFRSDIHFLVFIRVYNLSLGLVSDEKHSSIVFVVVIVVAAAAAVSVAIAVFAKVIIK